MEASENQIVSLIMEGIKYARAQEALIAVLGYMTPTTEALNRILDIDEELAPEIRAALEALLALGEAVGRASAVAQARFDVVHAKTQGGFDAT